VTKQRIKYRPATKFLDHQRLAVRKAVRRGNLAFFMDPGTGKTKAAIDTACIQHLRGKVSRVAVLCPLGAIGVWEEELEKHCPLSYEFLAPKEWDDHTADALVEEYEDHCGKEECLSFLTINYDKISQRARTGKRWVHEWVKIVEGFDPDLVVCDESHALKRSGTNRSRQVWRLVERLRKTRADDGMPLVLILTGTPNPKGYIDIFSQFRVMDSSIFGTAKEGFEDNFCVYGFGYNKYRVMRYKQKKILLSKIRHNAIIVPESAAELPPKRWQKIPVRLPAETRRLYDELVRDSITYTEGGTELLATNPGVLRLRCAQITGGFTTDGEEIHRAKITAAETVLDGLLESEEQVVVYARFLPEVAAVTKLCKRLGFNASSVVGRTPKSNRDKIRRVFQARQYSDTPHALIFQVQTGSLAITLTNCAHVLFYSLPDGWEQYYQCTKRTHRQGQTRPVLYRHLICPGTVDITQLQTLRGRRDMHSELMRTPKDYLMGI
jgi:SNF2 family DNA or RNA helicase